MCIRGIVTTPRCGAVSVSATWHFAAAMASAVASLAEFFPG